MVQVKGRLRLLTHRLSSDFAGRVKYSTLWPSRRDSPSEASRAMPTSGDFGGRGNKGRESMRIRVLFAYDRIFPGRCQEENWIGGRTLLKPDSVSGCLLNTRRAERRFILDNPPS